MDAGAMAVVVIVLAVLMVGAFLTLWLRDKKRSEAVAEDSGRFEGDPAHHNPGR